MVIVALGLGLFTGVAGPRADETHYHFSGPLSKFSIEGLTPGTPTSGLLFSVVLTESGGNIGPTEFDLKAPEWATPIKVRLDGAKFDSGHLKANLHLENSSGYVLEGVRFDCDGATETYETKGADGKPVLKYRSEAVSISSPLLLGDIQSKDQADPQDVDAGEIKFNPETKQVSVNFKLSGLTYLQNFQSHDGGGAGRLSLDSKGHIYMCDRDGMWRCDLDGSKSALVTKYGDFTADVIVDPSTGEIVGGPGNGVRYTRRSPGGDDLSLIPLTDVFDHTPFTPCFAPNGDLYVRLDSVIALYRGGKEVRRAEKVGDVSLFDNGYFDVGADGSLVVPTQGSLYWVSPDWKTTKRISIGPDWRLGRLMQLSGVRRDAFGNMYVTEGGWDDHPEAMRVSVFDKNGNFVRVFGRADRTPAESNAENLKPGQLIGIKDIVFGTDGTVYIASDRIGGGMVNVLRPF